MEIINKKPLQEIQEDRKQEAENATVDIWEAIAAMGADLAEAQSTIVDLKNEIATLKGGV
ncbi:hypothetical protein psyc5s11_44810 [Clostridium gelidum]|uniref:Uncharacterized protein n=1 Tax=Clostridium gelidum TaxID=704125 RepID=A0ABN6J237_9CLOT|nr:hypothetical protein [Clostridium gelidum]BCZ48414.1 hypothetical protein psyc5s11_44810 [Clostridium gelidum]